MIKSIYKTLAILILFLCSNIVAMITIEDMFTKSDSELRELFGNIAYDTMGKKALENRLQQLKKFLIQTKRSIITNQPIVESAKKIQKDPYANQSDLEEAALILQQHEIEHRVNKKIENLLRKEINIIKRSLYTTKPSKEEQE